MSNTLQSAILLRLHQRADAAEIYAKALAANTMQDGDPATVLAAIDMLGLSIAEVQSDLIAKSERQRNENIRVEAERAMDAIPVQRAELQRLADTGERRVTQPEMDELDSREAAAASRLDSSTQKLRDLRAAHPRVFGAAPEPRDIIDIVNGLDANTAR